MPLMYFTSPRYIRMAIIMDLSTVMYLRALTYCNSDPEGWKAGLN